MSKKESKYLPSGMANISNEMKNKPFNQNMNENSGKTFFDYLLQYNAHQSDSQVTRYSPAGKGDSNYSFVVEPRRPKDQDVSWKDNTSSFSIVYIPECCANDDPDYLLHEVPVRGALYTTRKVDYGNILLFSHQKYVPSNIDAEESSQTPRGQGGSVKAQPPPKDQKLLQILTENSVQNSSLEFIPLMSEADGLLYMDSREKLACFSVIPGPKTPAYFSAAINLLLENPFVYKVYEEVYLKETTASEDTVELPICVQGLWTRHSVQKTLLVHKDSKDPQLSMTSKREYWIHLLEKVFISSHGSFASYHRKLKSVVFALHLLTGIPYQEVFIKGQQMTPVSVQYYLRGCLETGNLVAVSKLGDYGRPSPANIYSGTLYNVVDEISSRDGNTYFALRYPWVRNFDPLETKSNKQIVAGSKGISNNPKYESCIFMTAEEIHEQMDVIQSLKILQDAYQFCMKLGEEPNPFTYIELDVKAPGSSYLQVCQEEVFDSDPTKNLKQYHKVGIVLLKKCKDDDGQTFLRVELQHTDTNRDVWAWADLKVGSYFILVVSND